MTGLEGEVLIGILTAVTLILLGLFLVILVYSKRQKLQSPRGTTLHPFPAVQINMKELLTASPLLNGENSGHSPNPINVSEFEECRSKWHSTGHMEFNPRTTYRSSVPAASATHITHNPLCSEYASVDIQQIGHYRSLQGPVPPPPPPNTAATATSSNANTYNLGHFFPRVSSEPPSRKSYQTANRSGDPLKVSFPLFRFLCEVSKEDIVS